MVSTLLNSLWKLMRALAESLFFSHMLPLHSHIHWILRSTRNYGVMTFVDMIPFYYMMWSRPSSWYTEYMNWKSLTLSFIISWWALCIYAAWSWCMGNAGTVPDPTFTWALTCQHTSAGVNYAHGVRDSHDRVENRAQSEQPRWALQQRRSRQASNVSGWVRFERVMHGRTLNACSVGSHIKPALSFNSTCLDLAQTHDSDWFRLGVHLVYHLFSSDRESLYLTADSLHHDSAWTSRSNLLQSQPSSRVTCHLMPAVPADARADTSVVG